MNNPNNGVCEGGGAGDGCKFGVAFASTSPHNCLGNDAFLRIDTRVGQALLKKMVETRTQLGKVPYAPSSGATYFSVDSSRTAIRCDAAAGAAVYKRHTYCCFSTHRVSATAVSSPICRNGTTAHASAPVGADMCAAYADGQEQSTEYLQRRGFEKKDEGVIFLPTWNQMGKNNVLL